MKKVDFFDQLGFIFFAIAKSDNKIHPDEEIELSLQLRNRFNFSKEQENDVIQAFNACKKSKKNSLEIIKEFETFYQQNTDLFPPNIKHQILDSAFHIASAHAERNKSELVMLFKLKEVLES
jgi:uncharacterized tellurite resistance protein B-like protein